MHSIGFFAFVGDRRLSFGQFQRGRVSAVWKPDRCAGFHRAPCEDFGTAFQEVWQHADAGNVVIQRELASGFELFDGCCRRQQRVVDHLRIVGIRRRHRLPLLVERWRHAPECEPECSSN